MSIVYDSVIYFSDFISGSEEDEYGDVKQNEERSGAVFAELKSIGQSEFYQAQTTGVKPEIKFVIPDYLEYCGQKYLIHETTRYKILRTFRTKGNELEITCYGGVRNVDATISNQD